MEAVPQSSPKARRHAPRVLPTRPVSGHGGRNLDGICQVNPTGTLSLNGVTYSPPEGARERTEWMELLEGLHDTEQLACLTLALSI